MLSNRFLDIAVIRVGDVIYERSELQYIQSRKSEISVSIS